MRYYVPFLVSLLVLFASCTTDPSAERANADRREQVRETLARWGKAIEASDLETIGELTSEEAVFWTHGAPELNGREALKNSFEPFFDRYAMEQRFEPDEIIVSGEFAFVRGLEINRLTSLEDSSETVVRQRAFSVLHREPDGVWRFYRGMTNLPPEE